MTKKPESRFWNGVFAQPVLSVMLFVVIAVLVLSAIGAWNNLRERNALCQACGYQKSTDSEPYGTRIECDGHAQIDTYKERPYNKWGKEDEWAAEETKPICNVGK